MKKLLFITAFIPLFLLLVSPVSAAQEFFDDFTGSDGTALSTHNSLWVGTSGLDYVVITDNKVHSTSSSNSRYSIPSLIGLTDYCVQADFIYPLPNSLEFLSISTRRTVDHPLAYSTSVSGSGDVRLNVDETNLSSANTTITDGTHTLKLCSIDSNQSVYLDNDLITTVSDSTYISGYPGFDLGNVTPIDNFTVTSVEQTNTIVASPANGSKAVGAPFTVDVEVNSSSESAFNAARATVAVSSNLTVNSIHTPSSNACNLSYTTTPTTSNPSFAGAIFGDSSEGCTVYTMTLTPNDEGTGTVTFTNGSVKSYTDNSEILDGVTNASFTLGDGPTPTPTAMLEFSVTSPLKTYKTNYNLAGTKLSSITSIFVNGDDDDSEYPTSTTWSVPVTLSLGENNFTLYGSDGENQTATQHAIVDRHTLGDINGDGEVDLIDASLFAVDWDKTEDLTYILSDMNDDGEVNLTDLSILAKLQ